MNYITSELFFNSLNPDSDKGPQLILVDMAYSVFYLICKFLFQHFVLCNLLVKKLRHSVVSYSLRFASRVV